MFNFLKKIILLITTLIGFSGFGVLGIICYPYFYITGFRENEARYFFYIISKFVFLLLKPAAKSFKVEFKGNWPKNGAIITPNHSSILDIL
ncbi:MAG: hypothetical protein LBG46_06225, partial [Elusimicrobiota bacterium]|nr:hypothetical protein [Elusimicrobiota bacterium]